MGTRLQEGVVPSPIKPLSNFLLLKTLNLNIVTLCLCVVPYIVSSGSHFNEPVNQVNQVRYECTTL